MRPLRPAPVISTAPRRRERIDFMDASTSLSLDTQNTRILYAKSAPRTNRSPKAARLDEPQTRAGPTIAEGSEPTRYYN